MASCSFRCKDYRWGTTCVDNSICRLLTPRSDQKVIVSYEESSPVSVATYGAARSHGSHLPTFKAVEIKYNLSAHLIDVTLANAPMPTAPLASTCHVSVPNSEPKKEEIDILKNHVRVVRLVETWVVGSEYLRKMFQNTDKCKLVDKEDW